LRKGFTETDYARLLDADHQQFAGPLVVVWDNLNAHVSAVLAELVTARGWLTVNQLPAYAHELNPVEAGHTSKRSLANLAKRNLTPAHRLGQDPAQANAVPARPARRLPRQHRPRPQGQPA